MENSHPIQQFPRQIQPILKPIDTKENLIEVVSNSIANSLLDSQKQNIKEVKPKPVEKTQRIKKDKKIDKKTTVREETPSRNEVQLFQGQLIQEALQSLWGFITVKARKGVKRSRDLDKESMLEFLQLIEWQYSEAVNKYRKANINKETCGNLKSILSKFVNDILSNFPILQKLVYRMALEQYATGPLMSRFNRLMERNITPIIRIKSQNYLAEQAGEWYCSRHPNSVLKKSQRGQSVESQFEKEKKREEERQKQEEEERLKQEQDEQKKQEKKKRKNRRKKQKRESEQKQQEDDEEFQQINKFLQGLTIDQDNRVDCRVQEIRLQKWKQRSRQSMKNNHN